jgi:hypothetical protein
MDARKSVFRKPLRFVVPIFRGSFDASGDVSEAHNAESRIAFGVKL